MNTSHCEKCGFPLPAHAINCPIGHYEDKQRALEDKIRFASLEIAGLEKLAHVIDTNFDLLRKRQEEVSQALQTLTEAHLSTVENIEAIVDKAVREAFERNRPQQN